MAPTIAIPSSNYQDTQPQRLSKNDNKLESIQKRNAELERELRESREREERMRIELHKAWERVRIAEEAEELLCTQLGELEVEAVEHSREYHARLASLMLQLSHAHAHAPHSNH